MSTSLRWSITILCLAAFFYAGSLAGCEADQSATRPTARQTADLEASSSADPALEGGGRGSELARIAEQDVQAFLQRHRDGADGDAGRRDAEDDAQILWNLPARPRLGGTREDLLQDADLVDREADEKPARGSDSTAEKSGSAGTGPAEESAALGRDRLRELIVDLSRELYRDAAYADMPLRELILIAATSMVSPDRALNPEAIPGLTAREREVLGEFQAFFQRLGRELDGSRSAEETILASLDELRVALSTEPRLRLEKLVLCTRVGGFGDYDEFDRYAFLAHAEQQSVLYLELGGFTSELNQQGQWVTEVSLQLMIYSDRDGIPVWREDWQTAVDSSRNKRTDFFLVQVLTLPQALSVGRYHLKVRVRDEKSRAEAEGSISFEMVADPRLAATGARR